jgi:hypothetical protein
LNEFTIRIICDEKDEYIKQKRKELVDLLTAEGWFRIIEDSGEESAGINDIIVMGFKDRERVFVSLSEGEQIEEENMDTLALKLHQIFFEQWLKSRKAKKQEMGKNET